MLQVYYILEGFTSMMSIQSGHPMFKGRDLDLEAWSKALLEPSSFPPCPPHRSSLNVFYKQMFVWGKYYEQRTKTPKILSNRHEKSRLELRNKSLEMWYCLAGFVFRLFWPGWNRDDIMNLHKSNTCLHFTLKMNLSEETSVSHARPQSSQQWDTCTLIHMQSHTNTCDQMWYFFRFLNMLL